MGKPSNGYLGGFNPSGPGSYEDQFINPGQRRADELRSLAGFTDTKRNAGVGGDPVVTPRGVTTGGPALPGNSKGGDVTLNGVGGSKADKVNRVAAAAGDGGNVGTAYVGGKLQDELNSAQDWANPFAKPDDMGAPTPPPLVEATPVGNPAEWANPFPAAPPPRPPSKLREDDTPPTVAAKPSGGMDSTTILLIAILAVAVIL